MNFIYIVLYTLRKRGRAAAWLRFKTGLRGYCTVKCVCGRCKGRTCSLLCRHCVYGDVVSGMDKVIELIT